MVHSLRTRMLTPAKVGASHSEGEEKIKPLTDTEMLFFLQVLCIISMIWKKNAVQDSWQFIYTYVHVHAHVIAGSLAVPNENHNT